MPLLAPPDAHVRDHTVVVSINARADHTGVIFLHPDEDEVVTLHLLGNHELCSSEPSSGVRWVIPAHSPEELIGVQVLAALVQEHYAEGRLPYGLDARSARFGVDGALHHRDGVGLTCATFVSVLFESVGLPLVDLDSWLDAPPERREADRQAQQRLVESLSTRAFAGPAWLARVQPEVGHAPRLLPAEVAAASGSPDVPLCCAGALQTAAVLRGELGEE